MTLSLVLMVSVFGAGLLSFFSPCIFPVLPVYLGILLDADDSKTITIFGKKLYWYGIVKTLAFIFGLSTIFVILGYGAGFLGNILYAVWFRYLLGVFGLFYILNSHTGEYIYGGITPAQNNKVNHKLLGNLFISGESQQNLNNKIILEKDIVTFQEIDFKIRKYLMDNYKIYDATSPYVSGRIEIGTKDGKHEQIDLFDSPNEGTRSDIFAKYKDNRIINMKNFSHFDIYLEK
ncbi:exotoxin type C [Streptococcus pyogenes]|nr:cytochrome c biogenesis protein CcdA [Streptococcus pyogenes]VHM41230.1 exotoxin type C [Streptococcus pyogenes]